MNLAGQSATWGWQCTPDWDRGDLTHSLTHSLTTTTTAVNPLCDKGSRDSQSLC